MKNSDDTFLKKVLSFMDASSDEAEEVAQDSGKLDQLADKSGKKMRSIKGRKQNFSNFFSHLLTFQRLLKAYARKQYPNLPWKSLLAIVGSLLYFLNPLDFIPDFIPGIGLLDDMTLLAWVYKSLDSDIARFEEWEYENQLT